MVRARVTYNDNHLKALYSLTKKPYVIKKLIPKILWTAVCLAAGIFFLRAAIILRSSSGYIWIALAFTFAALYIRDIIKLLSDDKGKNKLPPYQYSTELIFGGQAFEIIKTGENFTVHRDFPYGTINKAVETMNYFFIFVEANKAFIIHKSELTEGSVPELEQFLWGTFGKRFVDKRSVKI